MRSHPAIALLLGLILGQGQALAASGVEESIDAAAQRNQRVARQIWEFAEVGYKEERSSALLQQTLADAGFTVEAGVAGIPTAFTASFGSGEPVIAILGEFDALPGISQTDDPVRHVIEDKPAGHACGHHLFGTASMSAAIATAEWLAAEGRPGTIRFYGTPAEEGGAGKVYMVRAGLFDDVDIALHWHAASGNSANLATSNANRSAKFRFRGLSAHAAGAPERGRSALDGVEAMNYMANMMHEHMDQEARMHYVITRGGSAPNVVPDYAEVFYYVRHPQPDQVRALFERLVKTAEGAALGTGTSMDYEVIHGALSLLPNRVLQERVHDHLVEVGGIAYDEAEMRFAEQIYASFDDPGVPIDSVERIEPLSERHGYGSTDVGDVSWAVPTAGFRAATWVAGTPAHSWQAIAAGGTSIGYKGMQHAAKVLALTAVDLYRNPQIIDAAWREFEERRGPDFVYESLVGDRAPPLDYRD